MESLTVRTSLERVKNIARFLVHQSGCWGELGDKYGQDGHLPHQASIQFHRTPDDDPDPTFPHGLRLKNPVEHGWERVEPRKAA